MTLVPVSLAIFIDPLSKTSHRVWLQERTSGDLKGQWEFPGGKIESGETPWEALVREIDEEVQIDISTFTGDMIGIFPVDYGDKRVLLYSFVVPWHHGLEGKGHVMDFHPAFTAEDIKVPILPANKNLIEHLKYYLYQNL